MINGTNGDTHLETVDSELAGSLIRWTGDVANQKGVLGRAVRFEMISETARLQDLLYLVTKNPRPAMNGPVTFRARVVLPPGHSKFLDKLIVDGDFGVGGAHFGNPKTQDNVARLSEKARGEKDPQEDSESIISDLKGHVVLRRGLAHLSNLTFRVPGAQATLARTYDLRTHAVDLHDKLALAEELSETTTDVNLFVEGNRSAFQTKARRRRHPGQHHRYVRTRGVLVTRYARRRLKTDEVR